MVGDGSRARTPTRRRRGALEEFRSGGAENRLTMALRMRQDSIGRHTAALISILAAALLLFGFGFVAELVAGGETMAFDRRVVLALRNPANPGEPLGPPWLQEAARDVTSLGSIVVVTIMTLAVVGYLLLSRGRAEALWMSVAVFGGMALNDALKLAFARPRPDSVFHAARVFTASFPSGHASLSAIAYLTIGALLARSQPSVKISAYVMALAAFLTVLIGMSRVYLGVHYPTDVLGGWCVGAAWAFAWWATAAWL
jgi:undecaprenyl-diphosphatase